MDKIKKFLKKLDKKTREKILIVVFKVITRDFSDLDLKKLRGEKDVFRTRAGDFRIIFKISKSGVKIIKIDRRDDRIYK